MRQFRYPIFSGLSAQERRDESTIRKAWTLEIVAGVHDEGKTAEEVARKELYEEAGHPFSGDLHAITTIYPSPGGSSERIHLFWAEADSRALSGTLGGVASQGEDTEVVVLPFQQALAQVLSGEICDAKSIVALQHLALSKG